MFCQTLSPSWHLSPFTNVETIFYDQESKDTMDCCHGPTF